jgi:lipopolysaccharide/colanic/teichoic acid biosynthesis glycosyltransferase
MGYGTNAVCFAKGAAAPSFLRRKRARRAPMNLESSRSNSPSMEATGFKKSLNSWRPSASALRVRLFLTLIILDSICIVASFAVAADLRGSFLQGNASWALVVAVLVPMFLVMALNSGAYATANLQDPFRAIAKGLTAFALSISALTFIAFYLKSSATFPRLIVTIGSALALLTIAISRYILVRHMPALIGGNPFNVVLLCDGDQPLPSGKFSIVVAAGTYFNPDSHDPVMYDRLAQSLAGADRVIVACSPDRRVAWAQALKGANIQSELYMPELDALAPLGISQHGGTPTVIVANGPLALFDRVVKRAFDVVLAGGVLILMSPLLAMIALIIKLDSRGPVLFTQVRIGRANQMFRIKKFRSMRVELSDGAGERSTARGDDRVTRVGRFIRKTSIDELPQLLNVVRGEMSIVGPRPHALSSRAADKLFWEVDERYWHRHAAKPGLTGLAQIRGYRGATVTESDLRNRLQADLEYLATWSIWRDIKIIVLTFRVLIHRNAF